ncbi:enoyl-CoA hydratase/isomerase family protein [Lampropedia aestuarii]|uniref:enoyl-CoA hydratase/isomerase family protein n=1 Tax=Lampropedia aestuarii TaxID=2562762 RepID=UPI0024687717|nr:enoyl-CoA hydratase-related protein [Lampropedia aestuarii]MDH5858448.1 enoyl-CoA hydratase-related protein [Lampropedia aestuarii]
MTDLAEQLVNTTLQQGIYHIELNRPAAGNAANLAMAEQLLAAVQALSTTAGVRVVLVSAAGRAFMAGGDLKVLQGDPAVLKQVLGMVNQTILLLSECELPIVCAVQGLAAGGGLGLALAADFLIAAEDARLSVGAPAIGLSPDAGVSWQLARWVGMRKAMDMALLCTSLDGQAALACGLVSQLVPKAQLMEAAWQCAMQLAAGSQQALRHTKRLLRASLQSDLPSQLQLEEAAFADCAAGPDFAEGLAALMDKRKPQFV